VSKTHLAFALGCPPSRVTRARFTKAADLVMTLERGRLTPQPRPLPSRAGAAGRNPAVSQWPDLLSARPSSLRDNRVYSEE
jgi:hypothetical protein